MSSTRRRWSSASRTAPCTWGTQRSEYGSWTLWAEPWCACWRPDPRSRWRSSAATSICPGCGRASWYGAAKATSVPSSASTDIAAATEAVRASRSASAAIRAPSALISWVPLSSARPSLGSSVRGSRPASRSAVADGDPRPSTSTSPRPINGSARCASGARSPDAPTLPCSGTTGWIPRARSSQIRSTSNGRQPECPSASVFARSTSIARTTSRGNGRPTPAAWEAMRLACSRRLVAGRDERRREVAEAGRHPVHDLALGDQRLDHVARFLHPVARVGVERRACPVPGDRLDVGDRQVGAGEDDEVATAVVGALGDEVGLGHRAEDSRLSSRSHRPPAPTRSLDRPCCPSSTRS